MADIANLDVFLKDVADAIRTKRRTTDVIPAKDFDTEILSIDTLIGQAKTVIPTTSTQEITPDADYTALTKVTVEAVTSAIDSNITASNIRRDISILGVTGTIDAVNNMDLDITANGIYTALNDYTGLGTVTVNVENKNPQNIPYYLIEQDEDGNLWLINNYDEILYAAYAIDNDGNFIVNQDDTDTAVYTITTTGELEVTI